MPDPEHYVCPECGPHTAPDEDGCCAHCGAGDVFLEPCPDFGRCPTELAAYLAAAEAERAAWQQRWTSENENLDAVTEQLLQAEAERDRARAACNSAEARLLPEIDGLQSMLTQAQRERDRALDALATERVNGAALREALGLYGLHRSCPMFRGSTRRTCTCGLDAAIAGPGLTVERLIEVLEDLVCDAVNVAHLPPEQHAAWSGKACAVALRRLAGGDE